MNAKPGTRARTPPASSRSTWGPRRGSSGWRKRSCGPWTRDYAPRPAQTGFADAFPLLVASEASLDELNRRLAERGRSPVPMSRFRPNVMLAGGAAFAEDGWKTIRVRRMTLDIVKPCARCVTTTVDQARGEVKDHREPLATLATFRVRGGQVLFGQYAIHRGRGRLAVGGRVMVLG